MDSKIMGLIDAQIAMLPPKKKGDRLRNKQYVSAKQYLISLFPGYEEYICKVAAKKYDI